MFRLTPVVKNLLIINVAVYLLVNVFSSGLGFDIGRRLALYSFESDMYAPWQYVTYMFMHGGFSHILFNMIGLMVFGPWLEELFGPKKFLIFYMVCGIGAGLLNSGINLIELGGMENEVERFVLDPDPQSFNALIVEHFPPFYNELEQTILAYEASPGNQQLISETRSIAKQLYEMYTNIPMVGASGAIFGLLFAVGLLFPYRKVMLLIPPIPLRVRILVILYGAYEVYQIVERAPDDNVAHFAHLGGMLAGYIVLLAWGEAQNRYY